MQRAKGDWCLTADGSREDTSHDDSEVDRLGSTYVVKYYVHIVSLKTYFNNQLNAQFLYSITICMLHYNPRHVWSINTLAP